MGAYDPSRPLSVLHVGAFPFPLHQGSQVYAGGMCAALAASGHAVWMATYGHGEGTAPPGVRLLPLLGRGGQVCHASGPSRDKPWLDLRLAYTVSHLLRRQHIDVVHTHNVEAPFAAGLAQILARRRVPWVYNLHTSLEEELPTYGLGPLAGRAAGAFGRGVDRLLARRADACVAISPRAEACLVAWGARRVVPLPPGVDLDDLEGADAEAFRRRRGLGEGPWVLYTGNLDAYQDVDVLLAAMVRVPRGRLLVVTGASEARARSMASAAGLPASRLAVVSSTDFADTRDALALAEVGVVPRAVCAGFPVKLLNLVGAGLPTVVAAGSAQPMAGLVVVPDRDPQALAAALQALLDDPGRRAALGSAGRADVAANWTWTRRAEALEDLYRSLL